MRSEFFPVLVLLIVAVGFGVMLLAVSHYFGPPIYDPVKDTPYECGIPPEGTARVRYSVKYYLTAMLFILFDIEVVFLYPWAVQFKKLGLFGFFEMAIFIAILLVGYVYIWKAGALEWEQ